MTDCAAAPEIFIPSWGEASKGVRAMVMAIRLWADARGSIDCTEAELSAMTGYEVRAVERHMKDAVKLGFVSRSERRRGADGRLSGYRYWLSGKLNGPWVHPTNCRVEDGDAATVDNAVDEPPGNLSAATRQSVHEGGEATRQSVHGADKLSGGEGPETKEFSGVPRERARAFPFPFPSSFLSFPWRDEITMKRAEDILAACGPMLGALDAQDGRVLKSLAYVLEPGGAWEGFDHGLDVLPVVKVKTGPGRSTRLWDFALLTENLETHRAKRLAPAKAATRGRASKGFVAPAAVVDPKEQRARRIAALRNEIGLIDGGQRPLFLLAREKQRLTGEWLEDAFLALRTANADELKRLESDAQGEAPGEVRGETNAETGAA